VNGTSGMGISSLALSILILAVIVALAVAGHSLWVLQREKKKLSRLRPVEADTSSKVGSQAGLNAASNAPNPKAPILTDIGGGVEPHLAHDDLGAAAPTLEEALDDVVSTHVPTPKHGVQASLLDDAASEPTESLETPSAQALAPASEEAKSVDVVEGLLNSKAGQAAPESTIEAVRVLHDDADCLVEIPLLQASSGDRLIGLTKSIRRAGGKPVAFEGLHQGQWEGLRYGTTYQRLRAGILLANRQGPLNAMEFSEFNSKLLGLGAQLGVPIEMPDMNAMLQRARSLDSMLAECDVQLSLAVDCSRALSTADLSTLAKRIGLLERGNNRYALLSDTAEVIYSVALGDKAQRLQLMFDVPRVQPAYKPWWKMAEAAHQASVLFDGRITDDSGHELSEQSFRNVSIALEGRQLALAEAGVPAGSALAMRVFN
jgi:hypothetical protein